MWKTALLLIIGVLIIPFFAFNFDDPLTNDQQEILKVLVYTYLGFALLCFVVSSISKNYSQVDKLWSLMPIIYAWTCAYMTQFEPRLILMSTLVTVWGLRLSYNFSRRGGYSWKFWEGEEDYRWEVLRKRKEFQSPVSWSLFNLFFISLYQMGLILLFTLPILKSSSGASLCIWDWILSVLFLLLVFIEAKADQQQWVYQNDKAAYLKSDIQDKPHYEKGFIDTGLWGIVRHPNYAAEQAIWIVFYFFSVVATGNWLNWSIVGFILLVLLFKGSADFSEGISKSKYPTYKEYIDKVPRFIPFTK